MRPPQEARMTEHATTLMRHELEAKIVKRCWIDEGFYKEFTANPMGAAVKHLQVPAASLPKIVVHQEAPGTWHIILPAKPPGANELSEKDLEKVAGGTGVDVWLTASAVSAPAPGLPAVSMPGW
jgi:hypothetical protein